MIPGIYDDLSNADYHAADGISKSGLDLMAKSPAHYLWAKEHGRETTPNMQKGSLVHALVLEPQTVADLYAVMPPTIKQRRGKEYDAWLLTVGNREIVTAHQMEDAQTIAGAVRANPVAMRILENADAIEQSIFAEDFETGALCKVRPDIRSGAALYDLKTTQNAAGRSFSYSARNYRYHVQAGFYLDVALWAGLELDHFGFIAVDTADRPYQCTVFHRLAEEALEAGRAEYRADLNLYARCLETGEWPGYPSEYDVLTLAGYAYDEEPA